MKVRMAVYGRHEPEFEVRLAWGVGETWESADTHLQANLGTLGVTPDRNGWEQWAMGGFELKGEPA